MKKTKAEKEKKSKSKPCSYDSKVTQESASMSLLVISHQFYHHMFSAKSFCEIFGAQMFGFVFVHVFQPKLSPKLWHRYIEKYNYIIVADKNES